MQPFYRPELCDLRDRRIDLLTEFKVKVGRREVPQFRWCQGEVIHVYDDETKPTVRVKWDPLSDVEGGNQTVETDQVLLPIYWKKDIAGDLRMDVGVEFADSDIVNEKCEGSESSVIEEESSSTDALFSLLLIASVYCCSLRSTVVLFSLLLFSSVYWYSF